MTFTQTLLGNEASEADMCSAECLGRLEERYDRRTGCRVPFCHSSLDLFDGGLSTTVVLRQAITGDAASLTSWRRRRLKEFYTLHTGCRVPFCQATLQIVSGSIDIRVVLDIPDSPAQSNASSNTSYTTAAVAAAARTLAAQPISALSAMMNETVVSTSSPVVSRMRRIDVRLVMSIPDASTDANATVAAITASASALAAQPSGVAALLNATVISTSPVVVGHAVVPLVVSAGRGAPMDVLLTALFGAVILLAIACMRLWRSLGRQDTARKQLLAEARERRAEREGEMELTGAPLSREATARVLGEHTNERVREEREQKVRSAARSKSFVVESRADV